MNCREFAVALHPYVDGELSVSDVAAAAGHAAECERCRAIAREERAFRELLRRQPREAAPEALRAGIRGSLRQCARRRARRPIVMAAALSAVVAAVLVLTLTFMFRPTPSFVDALIDKHIAYAQLERPAELTSSSPDEITEWFRTRADLRVVVPDFSGGGIRLAGARITDAGDGKAAYLLYQKGHTLLSVFMLRSERSAPAGRPMSFRGHDYVATERKGYRMVTWTDGRSVFGLVSLLDYDALLECADHLRMERARQTRI